MILFVRALYPVFRVLVQSLAKEGIFVEKSVLVEFFEGDDGDSDSDGFSSDILITSVLEGKLWPNFKSLDGGAVISLVTGRRGSFLCSDIM